MRQLFLHFQYIVNALVLMVYLSLWSTVCLMIQNGLTGSTTALLKGERVQFQVIKKQKNEPY